MQNKMCLFPDCSREVKTRSLCSKHYETAARLVRQQQTTWEKLQAAGKCTRATPRSAWTARVSGWFLETDKVG